MAEDLKNLTWQLTNMGAGYDEKARTNAARILRSGDLVILYFHDVVSYFPGMHVDFVLVESIDDAFLRGKSLKGGDGKDVTFEYKKAVDIDGIKAYLEMVKILARDVDFGGGLTCLIRRLLQTNENFENLKRSTTALIEKSSPFNFFELSD